MTLFTWFLCQILGGCLVRFCKNTFPQWAGMLATVNNHSGCWVCTDFPTVASAGYHSGFTLWTRHTGTGCKAGRLLTPSSNRHVGRFFPSWESRLTAPSHSSRTQFGILSVGWLSALQVEVRQPIPICTECKNRTANQTVQLMGWMTATLCKNIMVVIATDY